MVDNKNLTISEAVIILKSFKDVYLKYLDWYIEINKHIKAELLYGSVAKGTNRPDSDIDLLIIVPLETEERYTKGEYFYQYKGWQINIVLRSIEGLREIADEQKDSFQKSVFEYSVYIYEKDNEVSNLLSKIAKIKD